MSLDLVMEVSIWKYTCPASSDQDCENESRNAVVKAFYSSEEERAEIMKTFTDVGCDGVLRKILKEYEEYYNEHRSKPFDPTNYDPLPKLK